MAVCSNYRNCSLLICVFFICFRDDFIFLFSCDIQSKNIFSGVCDWPFCTTIGLSITNWHLTLDIMIYIRTLANDSVFFLVQLRWDFVLFFSFFPFTLDTFSLYVSSVNFITINCMMSRMVMLMVMSVMVTCMVWIMSMISMMSVMTVMTVVTVMSIVMRAMMIAIVFKLILFV